VKIIENFSILFLLFFSLFLNGCASRHEELVSVSEVHLYNDDYGLNSNQEVDKIIQNELIAINDVSGVSLHQEEDSGLTTELKMEEGTFLAEDYVPTEPVITYKYKFDDKFYKEARWRSAEF